MRNPGACGHAGDVARYVSPGIAAIAGELYQAIVGACPDYPLLHRARLYGQQCGVVLGTRGIHGEATALVLQLLVRIVCGQVRRYDGVGLALIRALVHKLAAVVDGAVIKRILRNGCIPVESHPHIRIGVGRSNELAKARYAIVALHVSLLAHGVAIARVVRIGHYIKSIAKG